MTHFDVLRSKALENYGIITSSIAADLGLRTNEVVRFCQDGRLMRTGYGTYRLADYTPTRLTRFAEAIAVVGEGSYVFGRSALMLCDVLPYRTGAICIATRQRVRRALPNWIELRKAPRNDVCIEFGRIPSQSPERALAACMDKLSVEQLKEVEHACRESELLSSVQREAVLEQLGIEESLAT